jgi:isoaspartyl peptidase/L-asparaginase-like protein (Ntn-hydrolase superfamily)
MDAAVMLGSGKAGAVACMEAHSPVLAAEAVLRDGTAVLLAGSGSDRFAEEAGVPDLVPRAAGMSRVADPAPMPDPLSDHGTVGAVAVSADGCFAAASSTGGRPGQPPGRVGDTPIPGAGVWAGEDIAVSATGMGEAFVMAGFSGLVARTFAAGGTLSGAISAGLEAVARYGGSGGGIALGSDHSWAAGYTTRAMARGVRHRTGGHVVVIDPE